MFWTDPKKGKDMNKFSERLKELRKDYGLSQDDLALKLGISRNSIHHYETERRTPNLDFLAECAMFFNVTSDYLLGISNNKKVGYDNRSIGLYDRKTDITRKKLIKRIDEVLEEITAVENIRWIPVTPETMPELEWGNGSETANLLLRVSETDMDGEEYITIYAGYFQEGKWWTFMSNDYKELDEQMQRVTHWMYADRLAEVV